MVGPIVPVVLLQRITSYVGPGTFATAPLRVEEYDGAHVTFWRGPLVGGAASNPFRVWFEDSHDALTWVTIPPTPPGFPITTTNTIDSYPVPFSRRWFRIRVILAADANGVVGISLWMAGVLERRVAQA